MNDLHGVFSELRFDYDGAPLRRASLAPDPIDQFREWFEQARSENLPQPDAMTLATLDEDGAPRARLVLLRGFDARGFAFFTSRLSEKGLQLRESPQAALVFYWHALHRSVRLTGPVLEIDRDEDEAYFATRPRGSQLAAWASRQSSVLRDRRELEDAYQAAAARWPEGEVVPCPPDWGGYRLRPSRFEFWQGRRSRLHDRFRYTRVDDAWQIERLAP